MADVEYPIEDFAALIRPLVGLSVSLPWQGYASALFLELGELALDALRRQHRPRGEACIATNWEWRVEEDATVLFAGAGSSPTIEKGILALESTKVERLSLERPIPELVVRFSNGWCLRTATIVGGDPQWAIRLPRDDGLHIRAGSLCVGDGTPNISERERAAFVLSERTAERWGVPVVEPKGGECSECRWFVRLDNVGSFVEYGVCIAEGGPLDGHAVKDTSGCPHFTVQEED